MTRLLLIRARLVTFARRALVYAGRNAQDLLATGSLFGLGIGFWMWFPPLGLIVPSTIIFGCLVIGRLAERRPDQHP